MSLRVKLESLGNDLIADFVAEFTAQGHNNTGNFIDSIELDVAFDSNGVELLISWEQYGSAVNKGRKPNTRRVPLAALMEWVQQRGIATNRKEIMSIAYAIQTTIFEQGSPTRGAFEYSNNGRRTGWVDIVLEQKRNMILSTIEAIFFTEIQAEVNQIAERSRIELQKIG